MRKKVCFDCEHCIVDIKDAKAINDEPFQWQCERSYWQDVSVCLECHPYIRDWAVSCKHFDLIGDVEW